MTVKGGTSPACAACKYQRRRCSSKCPLAPYFPASDTHVFQNAHKLFGVSKIMRILKKLNTRAQMDEAMKSIIYESNLRERFPVDGCVGYQKILYQQLAQCTQDLHNVRARLAMCREENVDQLTDYNPSSDLQLGMTSGSNPMNFFDIGHYTMNESNGVFVDCNDEITKQLFEQDFSYDNCVDDQTAMQMQMNHSQAYQTEQKTEIDYNDLPFDSMERDSSCGSAWKDTTENVSRNYELKNAAACFTLTSVN